MTDLTKKVNKKQLFQNPKMANKLFKSTFESMTDMKTSKDILDKIVDMKQMVDLLEHIAVKVEYIEKSFGDGDYAPTKRKHDQVKCDLCTAKF